MRADEDELLDGMVDIVIGQIGLPAERVDWRTAMRPRAVPARDQGLAPASVAG